MATAGPTTQRTLSPTPVRAVAAQVLADRLGSLRRAWRLVARARKHKPPAEDIHELRIQMRRLEAALALFAPVLVPGPAGRLTRIVKKARRRAGRVRDCDLVLALRERGGSPVSDEVAALLRDRRRKVIARLARGFRRDVAAGRLAKLLAAALATPAGAPDDALAPPQPFGQWFAAQLPENAREFLALAQVPVRSRAVVHPLRMAGKRVRYALDLGLPTLAPRVARPLHALLVQLQRRAGRVCDGIAMAHQYRELRAEAPAAEARRYAAAIRAAEGRAARADASFRAWWTAARRTALQAWLGGGTPGRAARRGTAA